jgi:hypothetical protein
MTIGPDLERRLDAWMEQDATLPDDLAEVIARLPETPQRHHRWSFTLDDLTWRTRTMFSATRIVLAAAIFAMGVTFALVAGPDTQTDSNLAPAASEAWTAEDVVRVSGQSTYAGKPESGTIEITSSRVLDHGATHDYILTSDDPRFSGVLHMTINLDSFQGAPGASVFTGEARVDAESGGWDGVFRGVGMVGTNDMYGQSVLSGVGANDGLSAVLFMDNADNELVFQMEGLVFPGDMPELP